MLWQLNVLLHVHQASPNIRVLIHPHHLLCAPVEGVHTDGCLRLVHNSLLSHCYLVPQPTGSPHTGAFFNQAFMLTLGHLSKLCAATKIFAKYATSISV